MFSASGYVQKRYANAEAEPAAAVVQRLQALVDGSGLQAHVVLVEALLNALTSPDELTMMDMDPIRTWLLRAAAIRGLGEPWEKALIDYANGLDAESSLETEEFYKRCVGTGLLPFQHAEEGAIAMTTPVLLISPPAIRTGKASGLKGTIAYTNKDEITIGGGLFEIMAGFQAPTGYKGPSRMGILQFATSDRLAEYDDGTKISRRFQQALDSGNRPWLKGASVLVAPGAKTVLAANDAPKWDLPMEDDQKRKLVRVAITDSFTTHVAVQTGPDTFTTLYTCEWTFTAAYSAASPAAATQAYTLTRKGPSNREIKLTGQEPLANSQPDKITK